MHDELTQEGIEDMPAWKGTAMGESPLSAIRRCVYTAGVFHQALRNMGEEVIENDDDDENVRWLYQAKQLWHVAGRACISWAPRRHGEIQGILTTYCQDLISPRRREGYERDAGLRAQLEAIVGDTLHDNAYMAADDSNPDEDEDNYGGGKGKNGN